ncbi:tetratricopeptide repeat protein [Magnetococcus sp. PR-3]|uniref:tetratricopeptide repeat protein n=1 Tax=Magnetococcus sp. PR-3 TaxID=3120355 RepID=UPI002FCDE8E4
MTDSSPPTTPSPVDPFHQVKTKLSPFHSGGLRLGRDSSNHVVLRHPSVAPFHLVFSRQGSRYQVNQHHPGVTPFLHHQAGNPQGDLHLVRKSLGQGRRQFVQAELKQQAQLSHGDMLRVGRVWLRVKTEPEFYVDQVGKPEPVRHTWLYGVILLFLVVAVGLSMSMWPSDQDRIAAAFAQAKQHEQAEQWEKARISYQRVLQIDPDRVTAHYRLGEVAERRRDLKAAVAAYKQTLQRQPKHASARLKLARFLFLMGQTSRAWALVAAVQNSQPELRILKAAIRTRLNTFSEQERGGVMADVQQILQDHPQRGDAALLLAQLYEKANQPQHALEVLAQGLSQRPKDRLLWWKMAALLERQGEPEPLLKALDDWRKADPDFHVPYILQAVQYYRLGQLAQVRQALDGAVAQQPTNPQRHLLLLHWMMEQQGAAKAMAYIQEVVQKHPELTPLNFALAGLWVQQRQPQKAMALLQNMVDGAKDHTLQGQARVLLAELLLRAGALKKGLQQVRMLDWNQASQAQWPPWMMRGLVLKGVLMALQDQASAAVTLLTRLVTLQPQLKPAQSALFMAHLRAGQVGPARHLLQTMLEQQPQNPHLRFRLAELMRRMGQKGALEHYKILLQQQASHRGALVGMVVMLSEQQRWAEAKTQVAQLLKYHPQAAISDRLAGLVFKGDGQFEQARDHLQKALARDPNDTIAMQLLLPLYLHAGETQAAQRLLQPWLKEKPNNPLLLKLRGDIAVQNKQRAEALLWFEKAREKAPKWDVPQRQIALLYLQDNRLDLAVPTLRRLLELAPQDNRSRFLLAHSLEKQGKKAQAISAYEKLMATDTKEGYVVNNLAMLLVDSPESPARLHKLNALLPALKASHNPAMHDTHGWVLYQLGRYGEAEVALRKALKKLSAHPEVNYHMACVLQASNQVNAAKFYLKQALSTDAPFKGRKAAQRLMKQMVR